MASIWLNSPVVWINVCVCIPYAGKTELYSIWTNSSLVPLNERKCNSLNVTKCYSPLPKTRGLMMRPLSISIIYSCLVLLWALCTVCHCENIFSSTSMRKWIFQNLMPHVENCLMNQSTVATECQQSGKQIICMSLSLVVWIKNMYGLGSTTRDKNGTRTLTKQGHILWPASSSALLLSESPLRSFSGRYGNEKLLLVSW